MTSMAFSGARKLLARVAGAGLMFVIAGGADAQPITKIAPIPSQWGLSSTCFVDANKGFACGSMMSLYKTLDGGATWTTVPIPGYPSDPLYNVTFLDANVGIVCGNSSTLGPDLYRTVNGGSTWAKVTAFPLGGSWYHQDYVSPTTGFMGSNGGIVRTTDSGATWQLRSGYPDCPNMTGMDFLDANVGFASGGLPTFVTGLFKTIDGGATWQHKLAGGADDVIYLSPTVLIAVVDNAISRSTNGGETWTQISVPIPTGLIDIEKLSASAIVGVSGSGDIWRSADGGATWTRKWDGEGDLPGSWSVSFRNALHGTVTGVRGLLYTTQDGGLTWARLGRGAAFEGNGIVALSKDTIVTVGHHGFAQRLTQGGSWSLALVDPPTFGRDTSYSAVSNVGANFVYAVGHWGGMARSLDGGQTWQNLAGVVSYDFYANDVKFTDPLNGWMTGWDYTPGPKQETLRTTDGGLSWQLLSTGNFPGVAIEVVGQNVWIQSGARAFWKSTNGGASFAQGQLPYNSGSAPSVSDLSFANANLGYVCGYDGYLVKTANGGTTWSQIGSAVFNTHLLGVLATGSEVWICGAKAGGGNAFIKRSLDSGATWQTWTFGGQYTTPYRMVRTASRLYASGYNGETWMIDGLSGSANTLTVQSTNPNSGVPMTVWTADLAGLKNGVTSFTRSYAPATTAAVTAPASVGGQVFDHWDRDGANVGTSRTIQVSMSAPHTINAVYVTGQVLTVGSQNPVSGVPITVWSVDKLGQKDGITQFTRTYTQGTTVSLTAPALAGGKAFLRWEKDGTPISGGRRTVSVTMNAGHALMAVFGP